MPAATAERRRLDVGAKIKVLVVDDSVVIRRLVTTALSEDSEIEVVGSAANGVLALRSLATRMVDAVTLDIEMPEMDGLETLKAIRKLYPKLVVIMFSTLSERGAAVTIEALAAGANDYETKAANVGSLDKSMTTLRAGLVPKLKQFFDLPSNRPNSLASRPKPVISALRASWGTPASAAISKVKADGTGRAPGRLAKAVVVGVSTGGPNALADMLPMLPANFHLPILVVQHMPPMFTRILAERLRGASQLNVVEGAQNMEVKPGTVYIAPGDFHMRVAKSGAGHKLVLDRGEMENSCRPAVDVLFRSALETYGGSLIAVMLTGMGQDGLRATRDLRSAGAYVVAQDEESSVVWGMPGSVVRAGLADVVVPIKQIAATIQKGCE